MTLPTRKVLTILRIPFFSSGCDWILSAALLVLLDPPGIVDEDYIRAGHGPSFEE